MATLTAAVQQARLRLTDTPKLGNQVAAYCTFMYQGFVTEMSQADQVKIHRPVAWLTVIHET